MARERLLAGAGEDTIHSNIIKAETPQEKFSNWWFYNKKILLVVVLIIAMIISVAASILSQDKPDYIIAIANAYAIDEDAIDIVEKHIAQYGEDLNGDGEVVVEIRDYYFLVNDNADKELAESVFEAASVKYAADMASCDSMIWLYDDYGISFLINNEASFREGVKWDEVPGLADIDFSAFEHEILTAANMEQAFSQFTVAMRVKEGSGFESDKKKLEYYDACEKLLENLKSDTKTSVPAA